MFYSPGLTWFDIYFGILFVGYFLYKFFYFPQSNHFFLLKMPLLAPTHSLSRQESGSKSSHRAHRPANAV